MEELQAKDEGRRGRGGGDDALVAVSSGGLEVGVLSSRLPSIVRFCADRCEYVFMHPHKQVEVSMVMWYEDMTGVRLDGKKRVFEFRIAHALDKFESHEYDPSNRAHVLRVRLNSTFDVKQIRETVWATIRDAAASVD